MRAVIQRVTQARVTVDNREVGKISHGLCVLLGVTHTDTAEQVKKIAKKIAQLRILATDDEDEGRRLSAQEAAAPILLVSQFTLYADTRKGRSPSWSHAAPGDIAQPLFDGVAKVLRDEYSLHVETGEFGAMMDVELANHGPFTLILEV